MLLSARNMILIATTMYIEAEQHETSRSSLA